MLLIIWNLLFHFQSFCLLSFVSIELCLEVAIDISLCEKIFTFSDLLCIIIKNDA